jgi:hypothetical protein
MFRLHAFERTLHPATDFRVHGHYLREKNMRKIEEVC